MDQRAWGQATEEDQTLHMKKKESNFDGGRGAKERGGGGASEYIRGKWNIHPEGPDMEFRPCHREI